MSNRVQLGWATDAREHERFRSWVANRHGAVDGYLSYANEEAMRAYLQDERGAYEDVMATAELLGVADELRASIETRTVPATTETVVTGVRCPPELRDEFAAFARKNDYNPGELLALARREYRERDGESRAERAAASLREIVQRAEYATLVHDRDLASVGGQPTTERLGRILLRIQHSMDGTNPREATSIPFTFVREAIAAEAGTDGRTLQRYTDLVCEATGTAPTPDDATPGTDNPPGALLAEASREEIIEEARAEVERAWQVMDEATIPAE